MTYAIVHNPERSRFETTVEGQRCVIEYRLDGDLVYLTHVGVPPPVENRGIAAALTQAALDWLRGEGMDVVPICPYVVAWIRRNPEYQALVRPPR